MITGTFAKLQNKREYNENEKIVLEYFFTNTNKNIYCAKNTLSSQLWAFLMGQYSRSSLSLRDRFLQLFIDSKDALEKGMIKEEDHISLQDLSAKIKNSEAISLDFFENKASNFLKKWGVDFGHNSLKDADKVRFAIEGISQVATKVIESPFPCLGDFQEKSTRYVNFSEESLIIPDDLKNSKYGDEIVAITKKMMKNYLVFIPKIKLALEAYGIIVRDEFSSQKLYENTLNAKAFDIVRYFLPANISTSLGASYSTRTLESHLSYMLSHPLEEIRLIGESMHEEVLKLSPWLLKHVGVSHYEILRRDKMLDLVESMELNTSSNNGFDEYDNGDNYDNEEDYGDDEDNENLGNEENNDSEDKNNEFISIYQGITDKERVTLVYEFDLDSEICASILFENTKKLGKSYMDCIKIVKEMDISEKENIMKSYLQNRGIHDRMPRALQHSSVLFEYLLDFGAYRDIQRHRASLQLFQGSTAIHGYDYPEFIDLPSMREFKESYDEVMTEVSLISQKMLKEEPFLSEYVCGLGHLVRTTFEMSPGQLAYVIELRTAPSGHDSYRRLFFETYDQIRQMAPLFSKYIKVGNKDKTTIRKKEK